MKKLFCIFISLAIMLLSSCNTNKSNTDKLHGFTHATTIATTPIKNQGRSPLCWIYAMLATIESDRLADGDSVNLSADYLARMYLADEAIKSHFRGKSPNLRGMMTMTPRLMERYGCMPYDSYHAYKPVNYSALCRKVGNLASMRILLADYCDKLSNLLDVEIGYLPTHVYMLGAEYTPREFAHSVYQPSEWVALTSFTHHPYGESFCLETPDNVMNDTFLNVPLDSMMTYIERSLNCGRPVCWEGDISENGFDAKQGIAKLENEDVAVDAHKRQKAFETRQTTDDHCMALVGMAKGKDGNTYFLAKNSWGNTGKKHGFIIMSKKYMMMKTIAVVLRRQMVGSAVSR